MNTIKNFKTGLPIPIMVCWQRPAFYGNDARIDSKGYVKRMYDRYRFTLNETGLVTVAVNRSF